jgi:hypothetical protein
MQRFSSTDYKRKDKERTMQNNDFQVIHDAKLDRSHIAAVKTREELIYLLSRAAELEHGLACIYLFAAYSLKNDVSEGGMTDEQAEMYAAGADICL